MFLKKTRRAWAKFSFIFFRPITDELKYEQQTPIATNLQIPATIVRKNNH